MTEARQFTYLSRPRPNREDRRFVRGAGTYVADVAGPRAAHVALVASPLPAGVIRRLDTSEAEAARGVVAVVTGEELARETEPLRQYLHIPAVAWRPLAHQEVRYAGEWVAAVVAETRAQAEDAAELVDLEIEPQDHVVDAEQALRDDAPLVHREHGTNVAYDRQFTWGSVEEDFAAAAHSLSFRVYWGRSSTVPLETFGVVAEWDAGREILDVWASIQMPQYAEQLAGSLRLPLTSVRVHYDVDVGGSYGVKRGIKQSVLAGYLARRTRRPVALIEDRIENMSAGDAHGPERIFDVGVAYESDGTVRSLRLATIDDSGAYPGRSPLQLGKPVGAIVGPYRIASVDYRATAVMTNKAGQVAVRGFGQGPTNYAIEMAIDRVARDLGIDPVEVRRRNFIGHDEFPYTIPSGTTYDSGDYDTVLDLALGLSGADASRARRDEARAQGRLAGIGISTCLEPSGGNALFEALLNPKNQKTTFPEGCRLKIDSTGQVTATIAYSSAGQSHETMVATLVGEELGRSPEDIRVVRADSQQGLPSQSPVASRMTIMMGEAVTAAAARMKAKMVRVAAHNLQIPPDQLEYREGEVRAVSDPAVSMAWDEIVGVAHREHHRMPAGEEPGLDAGAVAQVPTGGRLPTSSGRVHMYPCYAFSAHVVYAEIDAATGEVSLLSYDAAHDCGTTINPEVVRGMVLGGIAHGIGAALYEEFRYGSDGHPTSTTFVDYLLPSMSEVPRIRLAEHCTPSPWTSHGQKGIGEGGYMAAPAAVASAVNDALAPLGTTVDRLPMRPMDVWTAIRAAAAGSEQAS